MGLLVLGGGGEWADSLGRLFKPEQGLTISLKI